jgi:hypothetical protein
MRILSNLILTLSLATIMLAPASTALASDQTVPSESKHLAPIRLIPIVRGEAWKNTSHFKISKVDGIGTDYKTGELISISAEGKSELLNVDDVSGFEVAAAIYDRAVKVGGHAGQVGARIAGSYDTGKGAWQINLVAPTLTSDNYSVVVSIYCAKKESPCAATYGLGTQANKALPVKVR